jgi:hypothetical protein
MAKKNSALLQNCSEFPISIEKKGRKGRKFWLEILIEFCDGKTYREEKKNFLLKGLEFWNNVLTDCEFPWKDRTLLKLF